MLTFTKMARSAVHVVSDVVGLSNQIQKLLPGVKVINVDLKKETKEEKDEKIPQLLKNAEILLADPVIITKALYSVPTLKWVHCTWAGVDSIFKTLDDSKPLPKFVLSRNGQSYGFVMAEYVIGQIVAKERNFFEIKEDQKEKIWRNEKWKSYRPLSEVTVGILGVGQIGTEVAKKCKTFGMTVWGMVNSNPENRRDLCPFVDYFCSSKNLSQLLSNCDYICNILPSTISTRGLLNGIVLESCKEKKSVFINVGRGDVIDEECLIHALNSGWLSGAILDVFKEEPLDKKSKLWDLCNVTITPHVSAICFSDNVGTLFKTNYELFAEGKDLLYQVSWEKTY